MKIDIEEIWAWIFVTLFLALMAHMMTSCTTTKYVEVPVTHYEVRHHTDSVRDSIYVRDSVMVRLAGDTLYTDRWHTEYKWQTKYIARTDSMCDTIAKPVYIPKEVKVEKPLTLWQRLMMWSGQALWITAILGALVLAAKRKM